MFNLTFERRGGSLTVRTGLVCALLAFSLNGLAQSSTPEARNNYYTTDWNRSILVDAPGVLANDRDADGDRLEAHLHRGPQYGQLSLELDGSFTYQPEAGFTGVTTFEYKAWDGHQASIATVRLRIEEGNRAPVVIDDFYSCDGNRLYVNAPGVLVNDGDLDGDPLTVFLAEPPAHGTVGFHQDGSFWYDPEPGFQGVTSFDYKVDDGINFTMGRVYLRITQHYNSAPLAVWDGYSMGMDETATFDVLSNDIDFQRDLLVITNVHSPSSGFGSVRVNLDQTISYTPPKYFTGTATIYYTISDGEFSAPAVLDIAVGPLGLPSNAFHARNDDLDIFEGETVSVDVLDNDYFMMITRHLEIHSVQQPRNGSVAIVNDRLVYTPDPGFSGVETFNYTASNRISTQQARVIIHVNPHN